jgi:hypothetical protein
MRDSKTPSAVPAEIIERRIYLVQGHKVMLDSDLAALYQVTTSNLNLAVRRNPDRFPDDFMFQLTDSERNSLLLQTAIANAGRGGRRTPPYVFTELGVAMLSSVLRSERAIQVNILIMRAFIKVRELLAHNKDLAARVEKLEANQKDHRSIIAILAAEIDELKSLPEPKSKRIM